MTNRIIWVNKEVEQKIAQADIVYKRLDPSSAGLYRIEIAPFGSMLSTAKRIAKRAGIRE